MRSAPDAPLEEGKDMLQTLHIGAAGDAAAEGEKNNANDAGDLRSTMQAAAI